MGRSPLPAPCHFSGDMPTREGQSVVREKTGEFRAVLSSLVFTWLAHQAWQPCGLSPEGADHHHTGPTVRTGHDPPVWSLHVRNCRNCGGVVLESSPFSIPLLKAM